MNSKKKIFDDNLPPTNPFAERAILNILITNGQNTSLLKDNIPNIKLYSFYDESNRLIYQTICELCEKNLLVNLTSVMSTLLSKGILKKVGGVEKITTILNNFECFKNEFHVFLNMFITCIRCVYYALLKREKRFRKWVCFFKTNLVLGKYLN